MIYLKKHFKKYSLFYAIFFIGAIYLIPATTWAFTDPVQVQIGAEGHPIRSVWEALLNFANVLALIFFLAIAFANLLRIQVNVYGIKKILPSLIVGIILANFSLLISQLLLDLSGAAAGLFREGSGFTNQWINSTQVFPAANTGDFIHIVFGAVLKIVAAIMVMILAVMFILRNYVLMFLVVFAPIAFLSMALPATKGLWTRWWKSFTQWTFMLPVAMFWLWVGANFFQFTAQFNASEVNFLTGISFAGYVFGVICVYMAMTTPFKMAGELSSLAGKVQKAALTATGVYAGTRLAQRGLQGVKQAAGETIQGVALNRTPYGNIVRALKQTAEGRKSRIDVGMSGPVARSEWGQKLLKVATFGGRLGPEGARKAVEAHKLEKQDWELLAEERNIDDPVLQAKIKKLRTKATVHKGEVEGKKANLESKYYRGSKSKEMDKLLERFNEEELAEYEKLYQAAEKGGKSDRKALSDFIERKLTERRIATEMKRIDADPEKIKKEIEQQIIEHPSNLTLIEENKNSIMEPIIEAKIAEIKATMLAQDKTKSEIEIDQSKTSEGWEQVAIEAIKADSNLMQKIQEQAQATVLGQFRNKIDARQRKILQERTNNATISAKTAIEQSKKTGQWEEITLQYRDQLEAASYWQQTEGKRINDALSGEIESLLGPAMAEKAKGDAVLDFSNIDLRKIIFAQAIKQGYGALEKIKVEEGEDSDSYKLTETHIKTLLNSLDSDETKQQSIYEELIADYERRKDYWDLRKNRLKYSLYGKQIFEKGKGDAETRDALESLESLSGEEIEDQEMAAYLSGSPEGLSAKHQQALDRFSIEQHSHFDQNVTNEGFVASMHAIGQMMSNNKPLVVQVIDKDGRVLKSDLGLSEVIGRTFASKFAYRDENGTLQLAKGIERFGAPFAESLKQKIKAGEGENGDNYASLYDWLTKLATGISAAATTQDKNFVRGLLNTSGITTLLGIARGERRDLDSIKRKMILNAHNYPGLSQIQNDQPAPFFRGYGYGEEDINVSP